MTSLMISTGIFPIDCLIEVNTYQIVSYLLNSLLFPLHISVGLLHYLKELFTVAVNENY